MVLVIYGLHGKKVKEEFLGFLAAYKIIHFLFLIFLVDCIGKNGNALFLLIFFFKFRFHVMRASNMWRYYLLLDCLCISAI